METGKRAALRMVNHIDTIFVVYAIKRWHSILRIPQKYNKPIYAFLLSPLMLVLAWRFTDRIAHRYRHFLVKFCYPELKSISGKIYYSCDTHKELAEQPLDTSCWEQFWIRAPKTAKAVTKLYSRFYILQLLIVVLLKKKLNVDMLKQTLVNIFRSSLFLAGQTITMRILLCLPHYFGYKLDTFKIWLLCYPDSLWIWAERSDRVGQINNLVFAHILIGWLKKNNLLGLPLSLPLFLTTVAKDRRVDPITLLIAMVSTYIF